MKQNIHPTYYPNAKITCACGNSFTAGSTMQELYTEVCSQCHPFFTGKQKLLDTTGTVDKLRSALQPRPRLRLKLRSRNREKPEPQSRCFNPIKTILTLRLGWFYVRM
jgi:large subunit ribosomal protein L31